MSVLYTFPGQGAQCAGMLHALPDDPEVRRTIEEAGAVLGFAPLTLDNAQALRSTVAVQLSLLIAGVATARVLFALGHEADMVAGLSIGAYPAAVVAGALDYADAVRLVALRGRLMEEAYVRGYGMTVGDDGTVDYESTAAFVYDAAGRLAELTDSAGGTLTREYDDRDRLGKGIEFGGLGRDSGLSCEHQ